MSHRASRTKRAPLVDDPGGRLQLHPVEEHGLDMGGGQRFFHGFRHACPEYAPIRDEKRPFGPQGMGFRADDLDGSGPEYDLVGRKEARQPACGKGIRRHVSTS